MANTAYLPSLLPSFAPAPNRSPFPALPAPRLPLAERGLQRGSITEISGGRSSGVMATVLHVLAQATANGEVCAIVDAQDQFHPASASAAGVDLSLCLWVRCRDNPDYAMRAADLLLHAGGFGLVVLDLCETSGRILNRIPVSYWHRFRTAIEHSPACLLVCSSVALAKASVRQIVLERTTIRWHGNAPFCFLQGIEIAAQSRKPAVGGAEKLTIEAIA
jgi:hypothetical protein